MKKDITTRKDIELIVTEFYNKLLLDNNINHFFQHILDKNDLDEHLKIIVNFWQDILFGTINYGRNAMAPHIELHKNIPFKEKHFKIWLQYFTETVDFYFEGEKTNRIKNRAISVATIMQIKLRN